METVLIVEDDGPTRLLMQTALAPDGYALLEATNGREGLALFNATKPDIVLMDAMLPELNGFEACQAMKTVAPDLPILMVTMLNDERSVAKAFEVGATDYLTKPLHWAVTRYRVRRMIAAAKRERELVRLAFQDELTGLPNRRVFLDRAGIGLGRAERHKTRLAVMAVDIDGFKQVNDRYGHPAGDKLLCTLADRIVEAIRKNDTVARIGGDEFLVLLEDIEAAKDVRKLAEKIIARSAEAIALKEASVKVTASVGVALYPEDGARIDTLIEAADAAMYNVKRAGGGGCLLTIDDKKSVEDTRQNR